MSNPYDAFTEGVAFGGLRIKSEIRILMCYILSQLDTDVSKSGLNEIFMSTQLVNFFETNSALASLEEAKLVKSEQKEDDVYYSLTQEGKRAAGKLDTDLPISVREKAVKAAVEIVSREKAKGSTKVEIKKLEKGYHVILSVCDGDVIMMQTVLYASDSLQANTIGDSFVKQPEKLYNNIIDALTR